MVGTEGILHDQSGDYIPIEKVEVEFNVRTHPEEEVQALAEQIRQQGLLQQIKVRRKGAHFELVFGNRRLIAMKRLGWTKLYLGKHIMLEEGKMNEEETLNQHVIENIGRKGLNPLEIGKVVKEKMESENKSVEAIAAEWGGQFKPKALQDYKTLYESIDPDLAKRVGTKQLGQVQEAGRDISYSPTAEIIKKFRRSKSAQRKVMEALARKEISGEQINIVANLHNQGMVIDDALKEAKRYRLVHLVFPVNIEVAHRLEEEYDDYITQILLRSMKFRGTIRIPPELVYLDGLRISARRKRQRPKDEPKADTVVG